MAFRAVLGEDLHRLRHGERHGDRLCAAQGGFNFLVDQFDDLGLSFRHDSANLVLSQI